MINLPRIQKKAADIRGALATLQPLAVRPERDFLADKLVVSAAKYELLVAMEAALDLCGHLCVKSLSKAPAGNADCFELLAAGGVTTNETSQRRSGWPGSETFWYTSTATLTTPSSTVFSGTT